MIRYGTVICKLLQSTPVNHTRFVSVGNVILASLFD